MSENKNNEIPIAFNGWAPGNYSCTCGSCKEQFMGDKRAVRCKACAEKIAGITPSDPISLQEGPFTGEEIGTIGLNPDTGDLKVTPGESLPTEIPGEKKPVHPVYKGWDSERLIGRARLRHHELIHKNWEWRAFFNGWIEGRADMLKQMHDEFDKLQAYISSMKAEIERLNSDAHFEEIIRPQKRVLQETIIEIERDRDLCKAESESLKLKIKGLQFDLAFEEEARERAEKERGIYLKESCRFEKAWEEATTILSERNVEVVEYRNALQGLHDCAKLPYESFALKGVRDLLDKYKREEESK